VTRSRRGQDRRCSRGRHCEGSVSCLLGSGGELTLPPSFPIISSSSAWEASCSSGDRKASPNDVRPRLIFSKPRESWSGLNLSRINCFQ
jgi:hypothetical protein